VAYTFHEELLLRHLLAKAKSKEQKAFLINQKLDDMRATLLRQTMFAEFELKVHNWAEQGMPLTPALLKTEYRKLNEEYFGPDLFLDEELDIEWARITHFYYNFMSINMRRGLALRMRLSTKCCKEGKRPETTTSASYRQAQAAIRSMCLCWRASICAHLSLLNQQCAILMNW
jgi:oligoendopeptidase F